MEQFRFDIDKLFNERILDTKKFEQQGFTINDASQITGVSTVELKRYLSVVHGASFNYLMNLYRIEEAIDIWKQDEGTPIRHMVKIVGYRSWVTFVYWLVKIKY